MLTLLCLSAVGQSARATVGTGDVAHPAIGARPFASPSVGKDYVLVKNWDFGAKGTIRNTAELGREFMFHDQFGTVANGTNYGAVMLAPDEASALKNAATGPQPVEDPANPVRRFTADSLQTFLVPLNGAASCSPAQHNVGCGSFTAKWTLPKGGSRLGKDLLWETRIRMVTPPYYWFALWNAGDAWDQGAEIDLAEGFGYDNGGGRTNYDARYWHSNSVGGHDDVDYGDWAKGMAQGGISVGGIARFDASAYHVWQLLYRKDDTFSCFVDGHEVQRGKIPWTLHATEDGKPLTLFFLFDLGWGHTQVGSVNKPLEAAAFKDKRYELDYSRVYLRG